MMQIRALKKRNASTNGLQMRLKITRYESSCELPNWGRSGVVVCWGYRSYKAVGRGEGVARFSVLLLPVGTRSTRRGGPGAGLGERFKTKISLALPLADWNIASFATHEDQTWLFTRSRSPIFSDLRAFAVQLPEGRTAIITIQPT